MNGETECNAISKKRNDGGIVQSPGARTAAFSRWEMYLRNESWYSIHSVADSDGAGDGDADAVVTLSDAEAASRQC